MLHSAYCVRLSKQCASVYTTNCMHTLCTLYATHTHYLTFQCRVGYTLYYTLHIVLHSPPPNTQYMTVYPILSTTLHTITVHTITVHNITLCAYYSPFNTQNLTFYITQCRISYNIWHTVTHCVTLFTNQHTSTTHTHSVHSPQHTLSHIVSHSTWWCVGDILHSAQCVHSPPLNTQHLTFYTACTVQGEL